MKADAAALDRDPREPDREVEVAGERLILTTARAAVWPAQRALLVADMHIGKAATFRALGLPVPPGTTADTLGQLTGAIARYHVERVFILGDFLHSKHALPAATLTTLRGWRELHSSLDLILVSGNHDKRAGPPPRELRIEVYPELRVGPLVLVHHPRTEDNGYVLSGHLHPAIRISGRMDSVRLPCFWLRRAAAVLPAFGAFTGGYEIEPEPDDRVFPVTDDKVFMLDGQMARASRSAS